LADSERRRRRVSRNSRLSRGIHRTAGRLIAAARESRARAIADFSGFAVGAALETASGEVITGCNIENASYGLTMCAERVALFKALSEGHRAFRRLVVVSETGSPTPPCGACRQVLWEFAGNVEVIMANLERETARWTLEALLPLPFTRRLLAEKPPESHRRR
jgi:cytidine deaminase